MGIRISVMMVSTIRFSICPYIRISSHSQIRHQANKNMAVTITSLTNLFILPHIILHKNFCFIIFFVEHI